MLEFLWEPIQFLYFSNGKKLYKNTVPYETNRLRCVYENTKCYEKLALYFWIIFQLYTSQLPKCCRARSIWMSSCLVLIGGFKYHCFVWANYNYIVTKRKLIWFPKISLIWLIGCLGFTVYAVIMIVSICCCF